MAIRIALLLLLGTPLGALAQADSALAPLGWLAGCWRSESGDRITDEQWMAPLGDAMLGMGRTIRAGRLASFEHLRIQVVAGRATYIAHPSGQAETAFPATLVSDTAVAFENPAHDFPQRIGYRPVGADSIAAWIEGPSGGAVRRVGFGFRRVDCGGA